MRAVPPPSPLVRRAHRRVGVASLSLSLAGATVAASLALLPATPAGAGSLPTATRMISRDDAGANIKGAVSSEGVTISGNGRFVAFITGAALVPSDTNGKKDVYLRDLWASTLELVTVTDDEKPIAGDSVAPTLSDDGRYVSFLTAAANLIPNDNKGLTDAFVRDRYAGTTKRVAPGVGGALLDGSIGVADISGDGRYVAFSTQATNVVASDTNGDVDIFVRDLDSSTIQRVSVSAIGGQANGNSANPTISDDGRYVAFDSSALLAGGVVGKQNVYVRDRTGATTQLVNVKNDGSVPDGYGASPSISGNGQVVAFASDSTNLVTGDTNGATDVFVRNLTANTTTRVSLTDADAQLPIGASTVPYGLSDSGNTVLFSSTNPATTDTDVGGDYDVYLRNLVSNSTRRITSGPALADPAANLLFATIDDGGQSVAFAHPLKLTSDASFDQAYVNGPIGLGPFASVGELVGQQAQDFLGRAATAGEVSTATDRVGRGASSPAAILAQFVADPAFADSRAPMVRLYWAFFLRRPDPSGLTYWLGKYQAGSSLTKIAQSFAASSEFKNRYGTVTNQAYVKLVYQNVFERQPDSGGLNYWTGKLDRKEITRGGVIVQFSESSEGKRRLAGPTNITLFALAMFRTVPSAPLWDDLYPTVHAGEARPAWIAQKILTSFAYDDRFD